MTSTMTAPSNDADVAEEVRSARGQAVADLWAPRIAGYVVLILL